ncbi:MAG TPA: hypothetical protein DFH97_08345 [Clostridiales bacterium]|nr:hypothetical protein [Clostridiales bacterium]HBK03063.1 hypothetical protein [Clostridiales bacterium]HCI64982.1 hypothetical protein [Clostridiales bacterium]
MSKSMVPIRQMDGNLSDRRKSSLIQDLGLLIFLSSVGGAAATIAMAGDRQVIYLAMFALTGAQSLLAAYRFRYLAAGLTGLQVLTFAAYTLFRALTQGIRVVWLDYVWLLLPLAADAGMQLFTGSIYRIERANELLGEQMESVVLLDSLTGLYNMRALYIDLERQMRFAARNLLPLSLMVIRLRHAEELHAILSRRRFERLAQMLGEILSGSVRLEDRCYSIDNRTGEFAILLTCDKAGAELVRRRIEDACAQKDAFAGIMDKAIRVDLRIACVQYEEGIPNAIEFKRKVDGELQYDV